MSWNPAPNYCYAAPRTVRAGLLQITVSFMRRLPTISVPGVKHSVIKELGERLYQRFEAQGGFVPRLRIIVDVRPISGRITDHGVMRQIEILLDSGALDATIGNLIRAMVETGSCRGAEEVVRG